MIVTLTSALVSFALVAAAYWLYRRLTKRGLLRGRDVLILSLAGLLGASLTLPFEHWALRAVQVDLHASSSSLTTRGSLEAVLGMLLFCVPLEEAVKVGIVWPFYLRRRLSGGVLGVTYAVFTAIGFAAGEVLMMPRMSDGSWLSLLRVVLGVPAHIFFAGIWGYVLGGAVRQRYFLVAFLCCVVVHAIYDHIVFGRGPALLVVAVPMFATMAWGVWALLRDGEVHVNNHSSVYSLIQPPSVGSVRRVLDGHGQRLKIHWIFFGALVNLGVTLTFMALAVYAGHRLHVDFSLIEEARSDGIMPVLFLAGGLLASFPFSAYLVAKASGTHSVLEPAWAMASSIIFVLAIFSVTEPLAIVIAVGLAPVGFLLACAGAVLGLKSG